MHLNLIIAIETLFLNKDTHTGSGDQGFTISLWETRSTHNPETGTEMESKPLTILGETSLSAGPQEGNMRERRWGTGPQDSAAQAISPGAIYHWSSVPKAKPSESSAPGSAPCASFSEPHTHTVAAVPWGTCLPPTPPLSSAQSCCVGLPKCIPR